MYFTFGAHGMYNLFSSIKAISFCPPRETSTRVSLASTLSQFEGPSMTEKSQFFHHNVTHFEKLIKLFQFNIYTKVISNVMIHIYHDETPLHQLDLTSK
jgi:hypothetical protein